MNSQACARAIPYLCGASVHTGWATWHVPAWDSPFGSAVPRGAGRGKRKHGNDSKCQSVTSSDSSGCHAKGAARKKMRTFTESCHCSRDGKLSGGSC